MPNFPYKKMSIEIDRNFRNDLNQTLEDIESDIKELNGAQFEAIDAAEEAHTQGIYASEQGDYANQEALKATDQANYAKIQGDKAKEESLKASLAATNADKSATTLNGLKPGIETATTNAATQANYAKAQGEYAETRINNLINNVEQPSEVLDIRTDRSGVIHPTAKSRIDADYNLVTKQLVETAKQQERIMQGEISRYENSFIDFDTQEGLSYQNIDGGTGIGTPWEITSGKITSVLSTGGSICWLPKKIQDGILSVIWENPTDLTSGQGWSGLAIKGDKKNNGILIVIMHGTATIKNRCGIYKVTNGTLSVIQTPKDLVTTDAKYKEGIPSQLECEFYGKNISVKFNGKRVFDKTVYEESTTSMGYIGLVASPKSPGMIFSNYSISEKRYDILPIKINRIGFAGDSIVWGSGASDRFKTSWVSKLTSKLKEFNPSLIADNLGVPGATTGTVLTGQIIPNLNKGYDIVVIGAGTNDSRIDLNIPHSTAISNLTKMIKELKSKNIIPIICTPTPFSPDVSITEYNETSYWYNVKLISLIRQLAIKEKVRMIDNYAVFNNDFTMMITDKLHPNDDGYDLMYQNALNVLTNKF